MSTPDDVSAALEDERAWAMAPGEMRRKIDRRDDCWIWMGTMKKGRYPIIAIDGRQVQVRHDLYRRVKGVELPSRGRLYPTCGQQCCVNPVHQLAPQLRVKEQKPLGRPPASGAARTNLLKIRVTRTERHQIAEAAQRHGYGNISAYIRAISIGDEAAS